MTARLDDKRAAAGGFAAGVDDDGRIAHAVEAWARRAEGNEAAVAHRVWGIDCEAE